MAPMTVRAALLAALIFSGCGPMIYGSGQPAKSKHFVLTVRNDDLAYPVTASVSWWSGSTVLATVDKLIPPGGIQMWDMNTNVPDGLSVQATAWSNGFVLQSPDYADAFEVELRYPSGNWSK